MTPRLFTSSILSNIFIIFANFLPTLIPFFRKTSAIAVATLVWVTFCFFVGLESANLSVFAPFARTLLPVFVQANCLSSRHRKLILWSYCRIYLPVEHCRMPWQACTVIHFSCPLSQHF